MPGGMQSEERKKQIEEIQKWLKQKNIHNTAARDENTILKFLSGSKYQTDKAKMKMKNFYEVRKTSPELFQGRDPFLKNIDTLLHLGAFFPLPIKTDEDHTLVLVKAAVNDPKLIPMTDVFKVGIMSVDLLMELDDRVIKSGVGVIIDLKGVSLYHALQMTPSLIRKMAHLWQDCYPIKINGIDFVNVPKRVDLVLNIFKRFLKENIKKRLRIHGSQIDTLHAFVNPKFLPEEYGGTLGPESSIILDWKKKIQNLRTRFLHDEF